MGTFAQRELTASSLNLCGRTGSHPSHRRHPAASFYVGRPYSATIPSIRDVFAKNLWEIFLCSPGYFNVVALLDAVCDPGVSVGTRPKRTFRFTCAYYQGIGTFPKYICFSGLRGRFRAFTLHLDRLAYLLSQKIHYRAVDWTLPGRAYPLKRTPSLR